jgi:hypothetical protein
MPGSYAAIVLADTVALAEAVTAVAVAGCRTPLQVAVLSHAPAMEMSRQRTAV